MAAPDSRRNSALDPGLHNGLTRLDIANSTPPKQSHTFIEQAAPPPPTFAQPQRPVTHFALPGNVSRSQIGAENARNTRRQGWYGAPMAPPAQGSQPIMIAQRTSPEDSGSSDGVPTPGTSIGTELHPAILHSNGAIEMQRPGTALTEEQQKVAQSQSMSKPEPVRADSGFQSYVQHPSGVAGAYIPIEYQSQAAQHPQAQPRPANDMGRLEALVAVATSENRAVEQRQ